MLRYRLPDGRSWKRLWEGWVGSFMMLLVLLEHREGLTVSSTAVPVPDSDAAGQHILNGAPVECGEDGWRETCTFQPAEKV